MFKKLFGSKDAAPPVQPSSTAAAQTISTIQTLTDQEEQLEKRRALQEKRAQAELDKAREYTKQKKKAQALMCLKKKKLIEADITNLDNLLMRIMEQRGMLEGQRTTVEVVAAMHHGAQVMKNNMKAVKIENVDKVVDEINDTAEQMRQINDAFAAPIGNGVDMDDDELLGELEELENTQLDEELLEPAPVPTTRVPGAAAQASASHAADKMPSVPTKQKAQPAKTQEELELEALEAEMALQEVLECVLLPPPDRCIRKLILLTQRTAMP